MAGVIVWLGQNVCVEDGVSQEQQKDVNSEVTCYPYEYKDHDC